MKNRTILALSLSVAVLGIITGNRAGKVLEASEEAVAENAVAIGDYACAEEANTFTVLMHEGDHVTYENEKGEKADCVFKGEMKCTYSAGENK